MPGQATWPAFFPLLNLLNPLHTAMKHCIISLLILILAGQTAWAGRAPLQTVARDPYVSALVLNADTGQVLFEKNSGTPVYPASVLKLMVLLVTLDRIEQGTLSLDDMVQVTAEASRMGGSQVYLDPKEQFSVEDLLYALMVQSANDAAVALAIHVAGSKEGFVALMNQKAKELGMQNTRFSSVHGLPPAKGQKVDVTTAGDFGILCLELARRPEVFKYTGTRVRDFRGGEFIMRNHNHLLENVDGCDGFKTGYFRAAGFSIAATAIRDGRRVIAIVMGSKDRKVRDAKATELLAKGFAMIPIQHEKAMAATETKPARQVKAQVPLKNKSSVPIPQAEEKTPAPPAHETNRTKILAGAGFAFFLLVVSGYLVAKKRKKKNRYRHRF